MRAQNIETANAVEALGCWLVLSRNNWVGGRRLRGGIKMRHRTDVPFAEARKRNFYVTQPMRTSTVQPLHALGFVQSESERFNAFNIAQPGRDFIEAVCDTYGKSYKQRNVLEHLVGWATGTIKTITISSTSSETLRKALSPIDPLPKRARQVLRGYLTHGDGQDSVRRKAILAWVDGIPSDTADHVSWSEKPTELDDAHWKDLDAGARFFAVRDAAIVLLDKVEAHMGNMSRPRLELSNSLPTGIPAYCASLRQQANRFLNLNYDPTPEQQAGSFCRECLDEKHVLERLVTRDGRILRLSSNAVIPGPAFQGSPAPVDETESEPDEDQFVDEPTIRTVLPKGISHRVGNMLLLSLDLQGKLSKHLEAME